METTGLFVGKFLPPHKGHLNAIEKASKLCTHLVVVVCYEPLRTQRLCTQMGVDFISLQTRADWVKAELQPFKNIEVLALDETGITNWPEGWEEWSKRIKKLVNRKIDFIFGNEEKYIEGYKKYFSESKYILLDPKRKTINISATQIRNDLNQYFDFIVGSAQAFFRKYLK